MCPSSMDPPRSGTILLQGGRPFYLSNILITMDIYFENNCGSLKLLLRQILSLFIYVRRQKSYRSKLTDMGYPPPCTRMDSPSDSPQKATRKDTESDRSCSCATADGWGSRIAYLSCRTEAKRRDIFGPFHDLFNINFGSYRTVTNLEIFIFIYQWPLIVMKFYVIDAIFF